MNKEKYLQFVFENGISFGESGSPYFIENYKDLDISSETKKMINENFSAKSNF